jgi:hypothetical protein
MYGPIIPPSFGHPGKIVKFLAMPSLVSLYVYILSLASK